jgi:hypothetical protein
MVMTWHRSAVAAVAACAVASVASAQAPASGSIRGIVTDREFGAPITGATVTVLGTKFRAQTRENGSYVLPNLGAGAYTLVITKDGYVREVKPNIRVNEGQLVDADVAMAGEFEDMEEFVVQDVELGTEPVQRQEIVVPETFEPILVLPPVDFQLRLEAPQLLNVLNVEAISRSGAGDAAAALLLVPGASLQDGKYAVIRGLPDRYVATLLDGMIIPSADPNKRAVKLDQFPAAVIQSIQVSKNFTPDQQGEASGGAVNIALRDFPTEGFFRISGAVGGNSQVKSGEFLSYPGGGLTTFGSNDTLGIPYDLLGQSWPNNPTTTTYADTVPLIYKWSVAAGNSWEVDDGVRRRCSVQHLRPDGAPGATADVPLPLDRPTGCGLGQTAEVLGVVAGPPFGQAHRCVLAEELRVVLGPIVRQATVDAVDDGIGVAQLHRRRSSTT